MNLQEKDSGNLQVEDYLEAVLDNFHDGIYITDREANTVYLNHSYELISGLRKSEMIGKNMKDLVEAGVVSMSGTLSVLQSGESVTSEQIFRTGKRAVITSTPIFDGDDKTNLVMVVTLVREITEIYSIRKELQRKEQQNRQYMLNWSVCARNWTEMWSWLRWQNRVENCWNLPEKWRRWICRYCFMEKTAAVNSDWQNISMHILTGQKLRFYV